MKIKRIDFLRIVLPRRYACFLLFLILLSASCKKEDNTDPVIILIQPSALLTVHPGDYVAVSAVISDEHTLVSTSVQLLNINFVPVATIVKVQPSGLNFNLGINYHIDNPALETGTYLICVSASDGIHSVFAYREIYVLAPPTRLINTYLIETTANQVKISALDSLNHALTPFTSLPGDYAGSSVSSRNKKLYVLGSITGSFNVLDADNGSLTNSIPPNLPAIGPTFTNLLFYNNLNFISYYAGPVRGYDPGGYQSFEVAQQGYFRPGPLQRTGNYLLTAVYYPSTSSRKLAIFNYPAGNEIQEALVNQDIASIQEKNSDEMLLFGNQNGHFVLDIYNLPGNTVNRLRDFGPGTIYSVYKMNGEEYYMATSQGLIYFRYDQNVLAPMGFQPVYNISYELISGRFYLVRGNTLTVVNGTTFTEAFSLNTTDSLAAVLFYYDR
ncbi:MAG: hypothetical protein IT242_04985 [Bacteroidia bacterium]|nr:hypothetical protein [Bacteroidia bacterium]